MTAAIIYTLDDAESDMTHLHDLLEVTNNLLLEMPYVRDGKRDVLLDRIASLSWIARDMSKALTLRFEAGFSHRNAGDIVAMFDLWQAVRNEPYSQLTEKESEERLGRYRDLQKEIIAARPYSPRDVAIQMLVDSDFDDSENSVGFRDTIKAMALGATGGRA